MLFPTLLSLNENPNNRPSSFKKKRQRQLPSLLLYNDLGTLHNPINIDRLLDPSPSPPYTPIYSPPRTRSAPVTAPCSLCKRHGHSSIQCIWNGPGICSYCEKIGHTIHSCTVFRRDRQCFDPHLLYCLTCKQSGHTAVTCGTFLSRSWTVFKSGILGRCLGIMLQFSLVIRTIFAIKLLSYLLSSFFLIFYVPGLFLFLLSFVR